MGAPDISHLTTSTAESNARAPYSDARNFDETIDSKAAAELLHCDSSTLEALARQGKIPGLKIGRSWVFVRSQLIASIQLLAEEQAAMRRSGRRPAERVVEDLSLTETSDSHAPRQRTRRRIASHALPTAAEVVAARQRLGIHGPTPEQLLRAVEQKRAELLSPQQTG